MRIGELEGSPSLDVVNQILERMSRGEKLISLAIGEPVYDTPAEIVEIAAREMKSGNTHYVSSYGVMEVRKAIVEKVASRNSISAGIENTIFIPSKQAIYSVLMAIAGKKNEVLVPDPGYFYSLPSMVAGFTPVPYPVGDDGSIDLENLEKLVTRNTAAIFVNTPSNPTAKVLDRELLTGILGLAEGHDFKVISDEAYEDLVYEKKHISIGSLEKEPGRVISIFTLSKSYSMTGWRAGYTVADSSIIRNMASLIEQTYTCSPPFVQVASAYALLHGSSYVDRFLREFKKKRDFVARRLNGIPRMRAWEVEGAFYAFPRYDSKVPSVDLARRLLDRYNVAVLPGTAFGKRGENHIRISFSGSVDDLSSGLDALEEQMSHLTD